jgi:hypothetical protein
MKGKHLCIFRTIPATHHTTSVLVPVTHNPPNQAVAEAWPFSNAFDIPGGGYYIMMSIPWPNN